VKQENKHEAVRRYTRIFGSDYESSPIAPHSPGTWRSLRSQLQALQGAYEVKGCIDRLVEADREFAMCGPLLTRKRTPYWKRDARSGPNPMSRGCDEPASTRQ